MDNGQDLYVWCARRGATVAPRVVNGFHYIQTCLRVTGYSADAFKVASARIRLNVI